MADKEYVKYLGAGAVNCYETHFTKDKFWSFCDP